MSPPPIKHSSILSGSHTIHFDHNILLNRHHRFGIPCGDFLGIKPIVLPRKLGQGHPSILLAPLGSDGHRLVGDFHDGPGINQIVAVIDGFPAHHKRNVPELALRLSFDPNGVAGLGCDFRHIAVIILDFGDHDFFSLLRGDAAVVLGAFVALRRGDFGNLAAVGEVRINHGIGHRGIFACGAIHFGLSFLSLFSHYNHNTIL